MADIRDTPTPSTTNIMQHPVHPTLVVFPVSFLMSAPFSDVTFIWTGREFWAEVSLWLCIAGLAVGLLAAAAGMTDFFTMREVRRHISAWSHFLAGTMALALAGANARLRWDEPAEAVWPAGLMLSIIMAAVVLMTGWLGGTLTFKHGIGTYGHDVADGEDGETPPKP